MARSAEEEIKEEIKKAHDWYGRTYKKNIEVQYRYDSKEKHMSWRIIAVIGGQERMLPLGLSEKNITEENLPRIKARLFDYIKQSLIKAQVKYEPHVLMSIERA